MKSYDELKYKIDGIGFTVKVPDKSEFFFGENIFLSKYFNHITVEQAWYNQGFDVIKRGLSSIFRR